VNQYREGKAKPISIVAKTGVTLPQRTFTFSFSDTTLCSVSEQLVYECRWHEILPRSSIQRYMFIVIPLDLCYANQDLH